jgi:hypothetical protein
MTTRIQELIIQANFLRKDEKSIEKFAELIVLECADFVAQNTLEDQGMWGKIVRHFGVEE